MLVMTFYSNIFLEIDGWGTLMESCENQIKMTTQGIKAAHIKYVHQSFKPCLSDDLGRK